MKREFRRVAQAIRLRRLGRRIARPTLRHASQAFHQKATRSPNWTWRGPDEVVARPNVALVISLDTPVRFSRLKALKSSPVTSNFVVSPSLGRSNVLPILVFTLAKPGPVNTFRPKLPDTPGGGRGKSAFVKTPFWKSPREFGMLLPKDGAFGKS